MKSILCKLSKNQFFTLLLITKLILLGLFSSDYKEELFVPFVNHFIHNGDNPWTYFYHQHAQNPFPYPPVMLLILSFFGVPAQAFGHFVFLSNFLFKFPLLLADLTILFVLLKLFPGRPKATVAFYFASPVIFYAGYIHSQLDLIPTALLLVALLYLMKEKNLSSAILFGLAISTKFHVIAALPLILIFLWKKQKNPLPYLFIPVLIYGAFTIPFLSDGYYHFVLQNKEQHQVFSVTFPFSGLQIYMSVMVVALIYIRFAFYRKINNDLFFSYIGLLFGAFLIFVPPMPGWYIWIVPFLFIYFINAFESNQERVFILDAILSVSYLAYFVLFHVSVLEDVIFLGHPLNLKIENLQLKNLSFTILLSCLVAVVYSLYNHGVRSNSIYKKNSYSFVIGISGDSGAGKSTLLQELILLLKDRNVLEMEGDGDHKWERGDSNWQEYTHLNPKANYLHRQSEQLSSLKFGRTIERVIYDHDTGKFTSPVKTRPADFIILSGLHPFYLPKTRKNVDLKIYLETEENLRRHWKIIRDMKKRGYTRQQVLDQMQARMPDAQKYIYPQKMYADLTITYFTNETLRLLISS